MPAALAAAGFVLLAALAAPAAPPRTLAAVLSEIDRAAASIHSLTAEVISLKYTKIVNDTTAEHGRFYYRKTPRGPEIALDITDPYPRDFIYRNDKGWIYQPRIKQVQEFDLGRNRAAVTQFLLLGLGGGGHPLEKSFVVTLEPPLAHDARVHLHLVPKAAITAANISSIDLSYDPTDWLAVVQQVNQPSGDYQRLDYSDIKINPHVPSDRFPTKYPGAQVVRPELP